MPVGPLMCIGVLLTVVLTLAWIMHCLGGRSGNVFGTETACPGCRHHNPTHARFCAHCGRRLV